MGKQQANKKQTIMLIIMPLLVVGMMIIGATYAYFQAQNTGSSANDITVTTGTVDNLNFNITDLDASKENVSDLNEQIPIVIQAAQSNFGADDDSLADGVTATATLIANDADYTAHEEYYAYINIKTNDLQYSSYHPKNVPASPENTLYFTDEETKAKADLSNYVPIPELYLTILKNGVEVTSGIKLNDENLNYHEAVFTDKSGKSLGGFDITEAKGLIKIEVPATIEIEGNKDNHIITDVWEITITFVNLVTDQQLNTDKKIDGQVVVQKDSVTYNLDRLLADAKKDDANELLVHDENQATGANDNSYRYEGTSDKVNNYVCFGSIDDVCPQNNLYRIIGLYDDDDNGFYQMKIIKADYATKQELGSNAAYEEGEIVNSENYQGDIANLANIATYYWDNSEEIGNWKNSTLNTENLNKNYYKNYLKDTPNFQDMISEQKYHVNDLTSIAPDASNIKDVYDQEIDNQKSSIVEDVGLMYVSDYGFATTPENWENNLSNYDSATIKNNNWLYMGLDEWTISKNEDNQVYSIDNTGAISLVSDKVSLAVRPTFYLKENVNVIAGNGTKSDPYQLSSGYITATYTSEADYNEIHLDVKAQSIKGRITKYFYSIKKADTYSEYQESTSNTMIFNDLKPGINYAIKYKVMDENENYSDEYQVTIKTKYKEPDIESVANNKIGWKQATILTNGINGSGNVNQYCYALKTGDVASIAPEEITDCQTSDKLSDSKTFSNLTANTQYTVFVKVIDNNNYTSLEVKKHTFKTDDIPVVNVSGSVNNATWTKNNVTVSASMSGGANGALYYCQGANSCTPSTAGTSVTDSTAGEEYVCFAAKHTVTNEITGNNCFNTKIDKTAPTCSLTVTTSGVSFGSKGDTGGSTLVSSGINNSTTPTYTSQSLGLSINTFYGHVLDQAGNTGRCQATISATTKNYTPTFQTCTAYTASYTCSKAASSSTSYYCPSGYSEKTNFAGKSGTYCWKVYSYNAGSSLSACQSYESTHNCNYCAYATPYQCWNYQSRSSTTTYSCASGTKVDKTCYLYNQSSCASGWTAAANTAYHFVASTGSSTTSCTVGSAPTCTAAANAGAKYTSACTINSYTCSGTTKLNDSYCYKIG